MDAEQSKSEFPRRAVMLLLLLTVPAALVRSQKANGLVEVPFEFAHNQIVVQVKIGGKGPFNMLLDTDTDPSVIDTATARQLGLQIGGKGFPASGGGTEANTVYPTKLLNVDVGGVTAKEVAAATIDLTKLAAKIGRPVHGVLGFSFLKDRIVQIDYQNSKLRFFAEWPYPGIEFGPNLVNQIAFPFRREDNHVIIDSVFVNNEKMKATLDTGSSSSFSLTPEAVALLGLKEEARTGKTEDSLGYNGEYESKVAVLKSVRLGRFSAESVPATLWSPKTGHDKQPYDVNIGNGFFQDFILTFDFRKKIVVFEKVD